MTEIISVEEKVLSKNDRSAAANRQRFREHGVLALNVVSSPGSGKTAFLQRTLMDAKERFRFGVVVGDLATDNDAVRMRGHGAPVEQITTGEFCHLEADMVEKAIAGFDLSALDILLIENVGNLVCPAGFDLGEKVRVVLLSITEGEDKPLKYPVIFKTADVVVINKMDLADAVGYDRKTALANVSGVAPQARVFEVSARTGSGMAEWYTYLMEICANRSAV
jgi:hydrogenase nickel incorporation protein HypB